LKIALYQSIPFHIFPPYFALLYQLFYFNLFTTRSCDNCFWLLIKHFLSSINTANQTKSTSKTAQPTPMSKQLSQQHAKVTSGKSKSIDEDVEFLEDDDDNQMDFDMAALNMGEKKPKIATPKPKKVSSIASTPVSSQPSSPKVAPLAKIPASKRVDVEAEYAKRTSDKAKLNMVVIGMGVSDGST
jgi:hypothetical protein